MSTVSSLLYYSEPLTPMGRDDNWCIDAVSRPPEVLFNFRKVAVETVITDLRDDTIEPKLDDMGFEMITTPTGVDQHTLLDNSASSAEQYQHETSELLKSHTGADAVLFFDSTLRREDTNTSPDSSYQSAHLRVHIDQSPNGAQARAVDHGGPGRKFHRFQIINVWRPLIEPVRNFPLAVCDYRSVNLSTDLVVTRLNFPTWLKDHENYSVRYNPGHRWYYWDSLTPDEVILFKCYDSASRNLALVSEGAERRKLLDVAGLCPHTAFFNERGPATGHLRTSLELRAVLFYDKNATPAAEDKIRSRTVQDHLLSRYLVRDACVFNTPIDEPDRPLPRVFDPFLQRRGRSTAGGLGSREGASEND